MTKTTILTFLLLIFGTVVNSFSTTLNKIDAVELSEQLKLYFVFDISPQFTTNLSGTQLSVTFKNAKASGSIKLPPTSKNVVRYTIEPKKNDTIVSIFFRYIPEDFQIEKTSTSEVSLNTTIGNIYSNSYKSLAQKLKGIEKVSTTEIRSLNPLATSIYRNNWENFFDTYEPQHDIQFPVEFTWPPFPLINYLSPNFILNSTLLPPELLKEGRNNQWGELRLRLPELIKNTKNIEQQQLLTFVYAEVLARSGNYEDSYRQASLLKKEFPNTQLSTLCHYLLMLLHAKYIDPYLPKVGFEEVFTRLKTTNPLAPFVQVNKIEAALATNNLKLMNQLLVEDNLGFPTPLSHTLALRQADYWHALQQPIKAAAAYRIAERNPQIEVLPYSQNGYCNSLYLQTKYSEAKNCYRNLKDFTKDRENLSLVNYMETISADLAKGNAKPNNTQALYNLAASFPQTKGGLLAEIKILDIEGRETTEYNKRLLIGNRYLNIASQASDRDIHEEASVKAALSFFLGNDYEKALNTLHEMRRDLRSGPLQQTSLALIIEILPRQIDLLFKEKNYKQLILLIQRNRELLVRGWLKPQSSRKVAQSYYELGLYQEAFSIFSYIASSEHLTSDYASKIYIPLLTSANKLGKNSQVIDYATEFQYLFPSNKEQNTIALIKCEAFFALGQEDKALAELPDTTEGKRLQRKIYFYQKKFTTVIQLTQNLPPQTDQEYFFVAESYYQQGSLKYALPLFEKIETDSQYWPQSQYRLAEYYSVLKQKQKADQTTNNLINKAPNSIWGKLAQKSIQLQNLQ